MLKIEFLYYDKTDCKRCIATYKAVKSAIKQAGTDVIFTERKLPESRTSISPTVLINGKDVEKILHPNMKIRTNVCRDCCDTAPVQCRTFTYKGKSYDYIPKKMIKDAIKISLKKAAKHLESPDISLNL